MITAKTIIHNFTSNHPFFFTCITMRVLLSLRPQALPNSSDSWNSSVQVHRAQCLVRKLCSPMAINTMLSPSSVECTIPLPINGIPSDQANAVGIRGDGGAAIRFRDLSSVIPLSTQ
jgi:hypothetical protein